MASIIHIRCEASQHIGFGHLRRCLILADTFKARNTTPVFLLRESDGQARNIVEQSGHKIHLLPSGIDLSDETQYYPENIRNILLDLVHRNSISDGQALLSLLDSISQKNIRTAFIDGLFEEAFGHIGQWRVHCAIQPYVGAEEGSKPPCDLWLAGSEYAILEDRYKSLPRRTIADAAKKILITFGGSDPQGLTPFVMKSLAELTNKHIRAVVGPFFSEEHRNQIRALTIQNPHLFQCIEGKMDLVPDYLWADIAIGGSGTSRYEFAATGLPAVFTAIYPYHDRLSRLYAQQGLAVYLGEYAGLSETDWLNGVNALIENKELRKALSAKGYKDIDSQGAHRLVTHLNKSVFRLEE